MTLTKGGTYSIPKGYTDGVNITLDLSTIATAITNKGVATSSIDSFQIMPENIDKINRLGKLALDIGNAGNAGSGTITYSSDYIQSASQTNGSTFEVIIKKNFKGIGHSTCSVSTSGEELLNRQGIFLEEYILRLQIHIMNFMQGRL